MKKLKEILVTKGDTIWSISPDQSVYEAICLLAEKEIGALAVMENDHLIGIISERDYARQIILKDRSSRKTLVREIMTTDLVTGRRHQKTRECMEMMTQHRIRHLPVLDRNDALIGIVSMGDLVREIIAEQESTIVDLEKYISG